MTMNTVLTLQNPVLRAFLFYSSVLIGKTLFMAPLTARWRFQKKVFISSEDALLPGSKVKHDDEDVERVRRAHHNDLENIPMFLAAGFIYVLTGPSQWLAIMLFRIYTIARIIHTYVYAIHVLPQPARGISWFIAYAINWYMVLTAMAKFFTF